MVLRLFVEEQDGSSRMLELADGVVRIGRGPDNEVVLRDQRSSRHHCRLIRTPQGLLLEDLKSSNGTTIAGKNIDTALLNPGDEFRIGLARLIVEPEEKGMLGERRPVASPPDVASAATTVDVPPVKTADRERDAAGRRGEALFLVATEGPATGARVPIGGEEIVIGRSRKASLRLHDERVSSRHARIVRRNGAAVVEDLGSKNGVLVDGARIEEAVVEPGSVVRIGASVFLIEGPGTSSRASVPASASAPAPAPASRKRTRARSATPVDEAGASGGEELVIRRADVDRALATERVRQPLIAGALIVVTMLLAFFLFDLVRHYLRRTDLDPAREGNLIGADWSFERALREVTNGSSEASVSGWELVPAGVGTIERTRDGAQFPGEWALAVESGSGTVPAIARNSHPIVVVPERSYRLEGFARADTAFFAGFLIDWLRPGEGGDAVVRTELSRVAPGPGESIDSVLELTSPEGVAHARVACLVAGGGRGIFDRVSFHAIEPAGASDAATSGSTDRGVDRFDIGAKDAPFTLRLDARGRFRFDAPHRTLVEAIWGGPAADTIGFGPELSRPIVEPGDRGAVHVSTSIPVVAESRWDTVEAIAHGTDSEASLSFRIASAAESGSPLGELVAEGTERGGEERSALALWLVLSSAQTPVLLHGTESRRSTAEKAALDGVRELVVGSRFERTSFAFSKPVEIEYRPEFLGRPRPALRLVVAGGDPELEVRIVPGSLSEKEAAAKLIRDAVRLREQGQLAAAVDLLAEIRKSWPEEEASIRKADELLLAWREAGRAIVRDLDREVGELEREPSPVVLDVLRARAESWAERLAGTPEAEALAGIVARLDAYRARRAASAADQAFEERLDRARRHFEQGLATLAELELRRILEEPLDENRAIEVRGMLERIASRRESETARILAE